MGCNYLSLSEIPASGTKVLRCIAVKFYQNQSIFFMISWLCCKRTPLSHPLFSLIPQSDPKRLKKELPKALKTIKPEDRLLLIGASHAPFDGEMKPMTSCYQKILLIPRPDYASRHCQYTTWTLTHWGLNKMADIWQMTFFVFDNCYLNQNFPEICFQ